MSVMQILAVNKLAKGLRKQDDSFCWDDWDAD